MDGDTQVVSAPPRPRELVVVAADSPAGLDAAARELGRSLSARPDRPLADVARELQLARPDGPYRRAIVAGDTTEAARLLGTAGPAGEPVTGERPVGFLFPGVGDQYAGMARGLYRHEPVFRDTFDHCAGLLAPEIGTDLRELLYGGDGEPARPGGIDLKALLGRKRTGPSPIERTLVAQPLVFCVEYALARLLCRWGITPSAMVGYSVGEYVAACLAGVFSVEDAAVLVARRADFVEMLPGGAMLAVMLGHDELVSRMDGELSVSAVDGPNLCVVAGATDAVERFERRLTAEGIANLRASTSHAFHSDMMAPAEPWLEGLVSTFRPGPPAIPFLSNVTGTWIGDEEAADPAYWAAHLRRPVRFHEALTELWRLDDVVALEVGGGQMLGGLAAQHPDRPPGGEPPVFSTIPGASGDRDDMAAVLGAVGRLWQAGVPVDWTGLWPDEES